MNSNFCIEGEHTVEIRISVRNLVEFILRGGDIDNRRVAGGDNAMAEGSRIHRMIQRRMGSNYQAEVMLRHRQEMGTYTLVIEGRADGILEEETGITVDEIKGTYRDLAHLKEPAQVHLAQAKCYACIYALQKELDHIRVRMTYCNIETEEIKYFYSEYGAVELQEWFTGVLEEYRKWSDYECSWKEKRQNSIKSMEFPFPYREGQKELAASVYRTIYHKKKLFIEAPTGAGKTITTVFPAIKAMGEGRADKLFYLTAKTITGTVAQEAVSLLRRQGLCFKSVTLTARDKICFLEETDCRPDRCPYAKGHYDRVNDAIYELLTQEDGFSREMVELYARRHEVCPFEMCLDMSLFADAVIGDYNYVFDPHVYLRRFFAESSSGDYIFLVDEAHNLLERGRQMYSAALRKEAFLEFKKQIKEYDTRMEKQAEKCNKELLALKRECESYRIVEYIGGFTQACTRLHAAMEEFLEKQDDSDIRKKVLDFYFEIAHFLMIYELVDDNYVTFTELLADGGFQLKLFCVNPSLNLRECMDRGVSSILFSATLLPIQYYKGLLGGTEEDYEVYAKSVFDPKRRAIYIGNDVTSKYTRRSDLEYYRIASYIHEVTKNRHGNYMVFFPSHAFLRQVYELYCSHFQEEMQTECIIQEDRMDEEAREAFLERFAGREPVSFEGLIQMEVEQEETEGEAVRPTCPGGSGTVEEERSLIGFCVMGGIFSEGIDLKHDSLIGVIVVGTGLPQICSEREILKQYFDEESGSGFDYAYRYPGMNKVLQAAGRVIRTVQDVGIIVLLDERFRQPAYQRMFPREWEKIEILSEDQIARKIERFWDEWL